MRWSLALVLLLAAGTASAQRDQPFDDNWRFYRGNALGAHAPHFDDSSWQEVDTPHDWSIDDLPPRSDDPTPILDVRNGTWLFAEGDDMSWADPSFDDSSWQKVQIPADWRVHSNYTKLNAYGWYRRHVTIPVDDVGQNMNLNVGTVAGADMTFFNGILVGAVGSFPPNYEEYWSCCKFWPRENPINTSIIVPGDNVVAVRVFSPSGPGGLYNTGEALYRQGPFDPEASPQWAQQSTGFTVGNWGWYRKTFDFKHDKDRPVVLLRFDAVYMNSDVWLNGQHLGSHPYGYTAFTYDISAYVKEGKNVLAVSVNNWGSNSRWYSGSGIFRHVWLSTLPPVYVGVYGVFASTPEVTDAQATVSVVTTVVNSHEHTKDETPSLEIIDPTGKSLGRFYGQLSLPVNASADWTMFVNVSNPMRWDLDTPNLYHAVIRVGNDEYRQHFGIRTVSFSFENGFQLNGRTLKMRGGCAHHDNGPLGNRAVDRAEERKIETLKAAGYIALRTSHNPPSPALMDTCDKIGFLVMEEAFDCWSIGKKPDDYSLYFADWWKRDLTTMIVRDRSRPSVMLWSIGNEIPETPSQLGANESAMIAAYARSLDSTRALTAAYPGWEEDTDAFFAPLNLTGVNYGWQYWHYGTNLNRTVVGTESSPYNSANIWNLIWTYNYVVGDFIWTAWDYIGESSIGHSLLNGDMDAYLIGWPWHISNCGDFDICGHQKPQGAFRQMLWNVTTMDIAVHQPIPPNRTEVLSMWGWWLEDRTWTWPEYMGVLLQVKVYTRYPSVHLSLNGISYGTQMVPQANYTAAFMVPYSPGCLIAQGIEGGRVVENFTLCSAGAPAQLNVTVDRSTIHNSRNDLAYVTVRIEDANGEFVPQAQIPLTFDIAGKAAVLEAVGSGDPLDTSSFHINTRTTYRGRALAIIRPAVGGKGGQVTLTVYAAGLPSSSVVITVGH